MKGNGKLRWILIGILSVLGIVVAGGVTAQSGGSSDATELTGEALQAAQILDNATKSGHTYHIDELMSECVDCHRTAMESTSATDRLIPDHDTCYDCHDGFGAPDDCETCHTDVDNAASLGVPHRNVDFFSHKIHADRGVDCETCHTRVGMSADEQIVFGMPPMDTCTDCHNGVKAEIRCETCHTPTALLTLLPETHEVPQWNTLHGEVARVDDATCATCHVQEQDCDACHRGDDLRGIPHREGFQSMHAFSFYAKQKECAACHDFASSCVACHQMRRIMPANHSFSSWVKPDGGDHAGFGATDLESCAACHSGSSPSCIRCHTGIGN